MNTGINLLLSGVGLLFLASGCSGGGEPIPPPPPKAEEPIIETFTFSSNGIDTKGKIYLPEAYEANKSLPAIFLIDYQEQHFEVAKDEFDKVIRAVKQYEGFSALVVTLEAHLDIDVGPLEFEEYYQLFKDMALHVDGIYTNSPSRTFIGRGSEGGVVLLSLFHEDSVGSVFDQFIVVDPSPASSFAAKNVIENDSFPQNKGPKKLHYSFSSDNDIDECKELIDIIKNAEYSWLEFGSQEYPLNVYEDSYPYAFVDAIRFCF